jgi:hypothetical protein
MSFRHAKRLCMIVYSFRFEINSHSIGISDKIVVFVTERVIQFMVLLKPM